MTWNWKSSIELSRSYPPPKFITGALVILYLQNDRKELQKLPDFYNSRCHLDAFCSLKNSHIADTPLCCKEEDPLEKDELSCVRVNSSSTGSSPSDSSSPLNNRRRKPHFFWGYYKETFILSVIIFMATATVFALEGKLFFTRSGFQTFP